MRKKRSAVLVNTLSSPCAIARKFSRISPRAEAQFAAVIEGFVRSNAIFPPELRAVSLVLVVDLSLDLRQQRGLEPLEVPHERGLVEWQLHYIKRDFSGGNPERDFHQLIDPIEPPDPWSIAATRTPMPAPTAAPVVELRMAMVA